MSHPPARITPRRQQRRRPDRAHQPDETSRLELGLLTGTKQQIDSHDRLLRSLRFGDDDYDGHALDFAPKVLGYATEPWTFTSDERSLRERFPNLDLVTEFLDLPAWLAVNEPQLFGRLFTTGHGDSTLPDGTVISAAEAAAVRLEIDEMRRQVERIRRDYAADPEAAIGQAKELIETACKSILDETGDSTGPDDMPALIKRVLVHLGLDPAQGTDSTDPVAARAAKRVLGGVSSVLNGAAELRNARGTGHGRSGSLLVDAALARMVVGAVLPVIIYLIEVWDARTRAEDATAQPERTTVPAGSPVAGSILRNATYGEGEVVDVQPSPVGPVATVNFGVRARPRRVIISD